MIIKFGTYHHSMISAHQMVTKKAKELLIEKLLELEFYPKLPLIKISFIKENHI